MTALPRQLELTIFALSSGSDRSGVAVVRVSGPGADGALLALGAGVLPKPRMATRVLLRDPRDGRSLDDALVLRFPAPKSFTGETVVELHVHGGRAVVRGVLDALGALPGLRLAEAGEFTRRAFENGKLDLTAAEALADLIDAETTAQRDQALVQLGGHLRAQTDVWRSAVLEARALVEAAIDFSDEGDVSRDAVTLARQGAVRARLEISAALNDGQRGEIVRAGFHVALVGPPNVGKSSLLNRIAAREAAIVSDEPGTTRDVIEVVVDLGGVPVRFSDTAGLRQTTGKIEQEGIKRAVQRASDSHLVLLISSPDVPATGEEYFQLWAAQPQENRDLLRVRNKADLDSEAHVLGFEHVISCATGAGLSALMVDLARRVRARLGLDQSEPPLITQVRHRALLTVTAAALAQFDSAVADPNFPLEIAVEHLRCAGDALGRLTGAIDPEEILGAIFGRFCIGK